MDLSISTMGIDEVWLEHHWWLLFPILGFVLVFFSIILKHRQQSNWMRLMRTYAEQGKEPPAALAGANDSWSNWERAWGPANYYHRRGGYFDVRRAILYGAIAAGCAWAYYHNPAENGGFGVAAAIMGALAVGYILVGLIFPGSYDYRPPKKPDEK